MYCFRTPDSRQTPLEATRDFVRGGETASVPQLSMLFGGLILWPEVVCCLFVVRSFVSLLFVWCLFVCLFGWLVGCLVALFLCFFVSLFVCIMMVSCLYHVCLFVWLVGWLLARLLACLLAAVSNMHESQSATLVRALLTHDTRHLDLFLTSRVVSSSSTMLEVLSAVTGESVAFFEHEELADASVKALKQHLGRKLGVPRFRLRILQDNCALDDDQTLIDDQTLTHQVVQLVILEFLPPDSEQDNGIMAACVANDDKLLEQHLNQPRNPNFEHAHAMTPLCAASLNGSLKCVSLLIEAGANKDQGTADTGATPLFIAAGHGHLEVARFLVESGANKDQVTTDGGSTPLFIAAHKGHLEVVQFLVESGANKDQGTTDDGISPLVIAAVEGHLEVVRFLVESGADKEQGTNDTGFTPLFVAAQTGHLEVVRFLVESGANKDQGTTDDGMTPLVIAAHRGHQATSCWILRGLGCELLWWLSHFSFCKTSFSLQLWVTSFERRFQARYFSGFVRYFCINWTSNVHDFATSFDDWSRTCKRFDFNVELPQDQKYENFLNSYFKFWTSH